MIELDNDQCAGVMLTFRGPDGELHSVINRLQGSDPLSAEQMQKFLDQSALLLGYHAKVRTLEKS